MGKFKAAFMFVTPDSDPKTHRTNLSTPEVLDLTVVGVKDYDQAARVARERVDQGVTAVMARSEWAGWRKLWETGPLWEWSGLIAIPGWVTRVAMSFS